MISPIEYLISNQPYKDILHVLKKKARDISECLDVYCQSEKIEGVECMYCSLKLMKSVVQQKVDEIDAELKNSINIGS